ncbi:FUSC family protein [Streptomyces sp. ACA25]|uniref:FUSC family protein n=1 Tax=Streptomyces sp. ACA25 TaxID=3022596 RepID=UPI002308104A|nr:FUSC family protein [Streptomyces sp. ACA25]MDB1089296.1 FUSC family protein [Streptomyces sp. ACA25]
MARRTTGSASVLRRTFHAPDPGLLRLRTALRGLLGTGLAVTAALLAGLELVPALTGGVAALLALYTVTDPTVRRQAVTTVWLPVAGLPVLALATVLHETPGLRNAVLLAIVFLGAYARRWGTRGNALGIFAFMMFFLMQFLQAGPAELPGILLAVLLALGCASLVRFGVWCIERRSPPAGPVGPAGGPARGLRRATTRQAVQVTAACGLALAVGEQVSPERWYWAVGTAWWIFVNTASRGETLVRGFRRVVGTVTGLAAGVFVALPLDGAPVPTAALLAVCVFGIFHTAPVSYSWMMFFVTVMVGLLYGLLGVLHPGLLGLRLQETAVGALAAALAVAAVLPVTTHAATVAWIHRTLECVRACTAEAGRRIAGDPAADPRARVAELGPLLDRVRLSLAPLLHPLNPLRARRVRARQIMTLLDDCADRVRALAVLAADPDTSRDVRLTAACRRVEAAVEALLDPSAPPRGTVVTVPSVHLPADPDHSWDTDRTLAQLRALERSLGRLAPPLHSPPRAPLARV